MKTNDLTYGIGETVKLTGVSSKKLRHWEERSYIPETKRMKCGDISYRRYTEPHILIIKAIKKYMQEGFTLAAAAQKAHESNVHIGEVNNNGQF